MAHGYIISFNERASALSSMQNAHGHPGKFLLHASCHHKALDMAFSRHTGDYVWYVRMPESIARVLRWV